MWCTDIANIFNDYFIDSTNTLTYNNINDCNNNSNIKTVLNTMFRSSMTEDELKKKIMSLNNTNYEGYDGISTKIIEVYWHT